MLRPIGPEHRRLKHLIRLLERVQPPVEPGGSLLVPCPHLNCFTVLTVRPEDEDWPLTLTPCHRHVWTLVHRECVEIVVREYLDWYAAQAAEGSPF